MEKRHSERIPCNLNAIIVSEGKDYSGQIENVSEDGVEYLITSKIQYSGNFTPDKTVKLNFQIPSGETLELDCEVKWFLKSPQSDIKKTLIVGMKIKNPPRLYRELISREC